MSSSYGNTEKLIANFLSRFPALKSGTKKAYQHFSYLLNKKSYKFKSDYTLREYHYKGKESFFGYYDHSPLNPSQNYLIFHAASSSTRKKPDPNKPVSIILFDFIQSKVVWTSNSYAYNWQQGSRLQWLDDTTFIFNAYDQKEKTYISRIVNTESLSTIKNIDSPIYDAHKNFALSLNFDRLNLLRPDYGYRNHKNITLKDLDDSTDGIFYVDLKNNKTSLLISIDQLKKIKPEADFKHAQHKVNHIMINPAGTHFMFMHRWIINGRRHDRLMVSDMQARNVQLVASGIVSHCCWLNNDDIFGFFTSDEKLPGFHIIRNAVNTFNIEKPDMFSGLGDGHPSALNNKILFDTYPDKARQKSLLVYNPDNGKKEKLGEFYESMKFYNETRCDLHPRWDFKGEYVFFDSVHKGKRKLYSLKYE